MPYQINPSERFSGECLICGTTYNLLTISRTPAGLAVQCWGALISLKHSEPILFSPPHKDQGWALKKYIHSFTFTSKLNYISRYLPTFSVHI